MSTPTNSRHNWRGTSAILAATATAIVLSAFGPVPVAAAQPLSNSAYSQIYACIDNAESISVPGHDQYAVFKSCCEAYGGVFTKMPSGSWTCYAPESPGPSAPRRGTTVVGRNPGSDMSRL